MIAPKKCPEYSIMLASKMNSYTVASSVSVSPGVATDDVTLFFLEKETEL